MGKSKTITVDISSSVIQVSDSLYSVVQIAGIKKVIVRPSKWWKRLFIKPRYAILMKTVGDVFFVLVGSKDEQSINDVFGRIRGAIEAQARGNFTYVSEIKVNGDIVNQSGNFAVGFNKGEVDISNAA